MRRALPIESPEPTPALLRVKAMIWFQSAAGAALLLAWLWAILIRGDFLLILGLPVCGVLWFLGLRPLSARASRLGAARDIPAVGLPGGLFVAAFFGEIISLGDFNHYVLLMTGNLFALLTALIGRAIFRKLEVPLHEATWVAILLFSGFGIGVRFVFGAWLAFGLRC